jgi:DNA-binding FadR family transcriptional regulator
MKVYIAEIASGALRPGERLPREADIATQFGVSRGVARECVRGLEERGLVVVRHGHGAIVAAPDRWDVLAPEVLGALLDSERGAAILSQYLECRRILEIAAAGLAAERASEAQLAALADAYATMATEAERAERNPAAETRFHDADIAFHRAIFAATGNRALGSLTDPIQRALNQARQPLARPGARFERALPEHARILQAIAAHDADGARAAMRAHLETVERYLREYARALEPAPHA